MMLKKVDIVMPMYNLIEYRNAYSNTSGVCDQTIEMNQLSLMVKILIFLLMAIIVLHSSLNSK